MALDYKVKFLFSIPVIILLVMKIFFYHNFWFRRVYEVWWKPTTLLNALMRVVFNERTTLGIHNDHIKWKHFLYVCQSLVWIIWNRRQCWIPDMQVPPICKYFHSRI